MFEFLVKYSDDIKDKMNHVKNIVKDNGFISFESMKNIFDWQSYTSNEVTPIKNPKNYYWGYNDIIDGYPLIDNKDLDWIKIVLPEPKKYDKINKDEDSKFDPVKTPSHYVEGRKYEPRKVIRDWELNFNLGSAVKYITRAGRKDNTIEDLRKAIQFIEFEIEELEGDVSK